MKKLIAVFSLSVLMVPVFALNAGVTTSDVLKKYPGQVSAQAKKQLTKVVDSLNEVKNAVERGYKLTGPEDLNQYGTKIREQLEKDYADLFSIDEKLASFVYLTEIRPVSQDIQCETEEEAQFNRVIAGFDGNDSFICQYILFNLADPFNEIVENEEEAKIKAKKYAAYKVKRMTLPQYIEGVEDILPWEDHEKAQLLKFAADVKRLAK